MTQPTRLDIEQQRGEADAQSEQSTRFPHASYEAGVAAALAWVLGDEDDPPIDL